MAGVPAEAQPTAPRMNGAAGTATPAQGAAQSGFEAELMAARQTGQVREIPARRSESGQTSFEPAIPADTGTAQATAQTGPQITAQSAQQASPEIARQIVGQIVGQTAARQGDVQTRQQALLARQDSAGQSDPAPAKAAAAGPSAAGSASASPSFDHRGAQGVAAPGAPTQTKSDAKSDASAKPAGQAQSPAQMPGQLSSQDKTLTAAPQGAQPRPDDTLIQPPAPNAGPNTGSNTGPNISATATPGAEAGSGDAKSAGAKADDAMANDAKAGDAKAVDGAQASAASARPSGDLVDSSRAAARPAAQEASPAGAKAEAKARPDTAAGKTAQPSGNAETEATPSADMRKQDTKAAADPSAQGLSGLKSDAKAGPGAAEARPDVRADTPAAQRAAFGQSRNDGAGRRGGEPSANTMSDARPAAPAPAAAGPVPAASRPLAELIAMQLQPLAQSAPLAPEAAGLDSLLPGDADAVMDPVQMRAEIRADALRTPGQAGQAARFTPHTVQHLAARVAQTAANGGRTFDIRLDPAELGRVRVRLEMGADNSVRAVLSAERADTLAELQRTSRDLVRALEDAGLDLAENGLEFSLSQGGDETERGSGRFTPVFVDTETTTGEAAASSTPPGPATLYGFALHARARLDVRI
jgi:hypothetical protein